jgi:toxin secretion/phage lysis holin
MKLMRIDHLGFASLAGFLTWWGLIPLTIQALLFLTALDMLTGWGKAIVTRRLSSDISRQGAVRKGMAFLLVAAGWVAHVKLGVPINLAEVLAGFFAASELLSILENCQEAGLRLPRNLDQYLAPVEERRYARSDRQRTEDSQSAG